MTAKHFIALAEAIQRHNWTDATPFQMDQLDTLADFCQSQSHAFKRERWLRAIQGTVDPRGGAK